MEQTAERNTGNADSAAVITWAGLGSLDFEHIVQQQHATRCFDKMAPENDEIGIKNLF